MESWLRIDVSVDKTVYCVTPRPPSSLVRKRRCHVIWLSWDCWKQLIAQIDWDWSLVSSLRCWYAMVQVDRFHEKPSSWLSLINDLEFSLIGAIHPVTSFRRKWLIICLTQCRLVFLTTIVIAWKPVESTANSAWGAYDRDNLHEMVIWLFIERPFGILTA